MWARKRSENIEPPKKRIHFCLSFTGPAVAFVAFFIFGTLLGIREPCNAPPTQALTSFPEILSNAAGMAMFFATVAYIIPIVFRKSITDLLEGNAKFLICDTCYQVKRGNKENYCECGGTFESFDNWEWIDD